MGSFSIKAEERVSPRSLLRGGLYLHEWLLVSFFQGIALLGLIRPVPAAGRTLLLALPLCLWMLLRWEAAASRPWSRVLREWAALAAILGAYWSMNLFAEAQWTPWQARWVAWDRWLLHAAGLKAFVEVAGGLGPALLETAYLLLYAIPPAALGALYIVGARGRAARFLAVLLFGTLTAYSLLPLLPAESPRIAFPGEDLPGFHGAVRTWNLWLLQRLDIDTSVFPSGHVAVAFSSAFGLLAAVPDRRRLWLPAFGMAALVLLATIYGRYHYAADGIASVCLATGAWWTISRGTNADE